MAPGIRDWQLVKRSQTGDRYEDSAHYEMQRSKKNKKTSLDAAFLLGILPGVLYNDTKVEEQIFLRTGNDVCIAGREQRI